MAGKPNPLKTKQIRGLWHRLCRYCQEWKPLTEEFFGLQSKARTRREDSVLPGPALQHGCKQCGRKKHRWTKYGLTSEQIANLPDHCEACEAELPHVDHNHATGLYRGMLCGPCNRALGMLQDDPERIMKLYTYIVTRGDNK